MVETFPVKELFDWNYTGKLEKTLSDIEKGRFQQEDFLNLIIDFTQNAVHKIKEDKIFANQIEVEDESKIVGICPNCGNKVVENELSYGCVNWKNGCNFTIWKNDKYISAFGKEVTRDMVEILLKNGKVGFRRLTSKSGRVFPGYFIYKKNEETGKYNWEIEFL